MKSIIYYYKINGDCPYLDWFNKLDTSIQVRVNKRVKKLCNGIYGDHKQLQKSNLSELRMDFEKGYRIYYFDIDETIIIFIAGSDKKTQKQVIQKANEYFNDFIERTTDNDSDI